MVKAGADVNGVNHVGDFPLLETMFCHNIEMIRFLVLVGANFNECLQKRGTISLYQKTRIFRNKKYVDYYEFARVVNNVTSIPVDVMEKHLFQYVFEDWVPHSSSSSSSCTFVSFHENWC